MHIPVPLDCTITSLRTTSVSIEMSLIPELGNPDIATVWSGL